MNAWIISTVILKKNLVTILQDLEFFEVPYISVFSLIKKNTVLCNCISRFYKAKDLYVFIKTSAYGVSLAVGILLSYCDNLIKNKLLVSLGLRWGSFPDQEIYQVIS